MGEGETWPPPIERGHLQEHGVHLHLGLGRAAGSGTADGTARELARRKGRDAGEYSEGNEKLHHLP